MSRLPLQSYQPLATARVHVPLRVSKFKQNLYFIANITRMSSTNEFTRTKYDDVIESDLLSPSLITTHMDNAGGKSNYQSTTEAVAPQYIATSTSRRRSVSQGYIHSTQVHMNTDTLGIWDYDTRGIDSLLGTLKFSHNRDRAESDFGHYASIGKETTIDKPLKNNLRANNEDLRSNLKPRSNLNMQYNQNKKQDWECKVCGNKNYSWRHVCNMRRCRAPKPGYLTEPVPPGSWPCLSCGNLNYAERLICNMRKCRAPRQMQQAFVPRHNFQNSVDFTRNIESGFNIYSTTGEREALQTNVYNFMS